MSDHRSWSYGRSSPQMWPVAEIDRSWLVLNFKWLLKQLFASSKMINENENFSGLLKDCSKPSLVSERCIKRREVFARSASAQRSFLARIKGALARSSQSCSACSKTPSTMSCSSPHFVASIPVTLEGLVSLNPEYQILICPNDECRKAVESKALSEHLFRIHKTKLELRRQVESYIEEFSH